MSLKLGLRNKIRRSRAGGFTGLLDQSFASGATAAYSLRRLKISATKAVRVREDSGNTETDIGFSGGTLDETALLNHVGSNNGFVTKWYDQSGNGNDASNLNNASGQPQIVSSGTVIKENDKPAIEFDGTDDFIKADYGGITQPFTYFIIHSPDSTIETVEIMDGSFSSSTRVIFDRDNGNYRLFAGQSFTTSQSVKREQNISYITYNGASSKFGYNNGNLETADTGTNDLNEQMYGTSQSGRFYPGTMQEIIIYDSDKSSDRSDMETNINNHYSIF